MEKALGPVGEFQFRFQFQFEIQSDPKLAAPAGETQLKPKLATATTADHEDTRPLACTCKTNSSCALRLPNESHRLALLISTN